MLFILIKVELDDKRQIFKSVYVSMGKYRVWTPSFRQLQNNKRTLFVVIKQMDTTITILYYYHDAGHWDFGNSQH